jgi:transposase
LASDLIGTKRGRGPNHPPEFKRQLVAAASRPDVSVSQVALAHGINVNMLFRWCRQHRTTPLAGVPAAPVEMLPVCVVADASNARSQTAGATDSTASTARNSTPLAGMIEIRFAKTTVRIDGAADPATIEAVLHSLRS